MLKTDALQMIGVRGPVQLNLPRVSEWMGWRVGGFVGVFVCVCVSVRECIYIYIQYLYIYIYIYIHMHIYTYIYI